MLKNTFSVIIPVYNEADNINLVIEHIKKIDDSVQIIVVDGEKNNSTINQIMDKDVIKLSSSKSRSIQMNKGAEAALGDILIFLHADTRLPDNAFNLINEKIMKGYKYGAFKLNIDTNNLLLKFIAFIANVRVVFTCEPYGDQAIFIRREYFKELGGYKEVPLMEDVELMGRIKKEKERIFIINKPVKTSPRRWLKNGIIKTTFRNHYIRFLYSIGFKEETLEKMYNK